MAIMENIFTGKPEIYESSELTLCEMIQILIYFADFISLLLIFKARKKNLNDYVRNLSGKKLFHFCSNC